MSVGMRVAGWVDSETRRLDLTESLRPPEEALATYAVESGCTEFLTPLA